MPEGFKLDTPRVEDGAAIWRIARDSKALDLNSSYSYLLWCRDFAATSAVARDGAGEPAAFITGYLRPESPQTLFVWQVAVDAAHRGRGLAAALLDGLVARTAEERNVCRLETTITADNAASNRLFASFAERHGAPLTREVLLDAGLFPEQGHDAEVLHRIGPFGAPAGDRPGAHAGLRP
ncbi:MULTISPECIES: diaminobutyrate acetyltransferase [Streptomyces]|uniref:L-2,4-diaminobutyric acid acetyltransferase n=2 Tax=Streptomyces rimosus subsp. rimosus TaxID=132474 RepID=L8EHQ6_STRR1|nr:MULTISPECIES: diaminobutyrate acetyltransferase [Streptomyces]KOG66774.1 2,4-diaminobutyric acid acetyltransferase [Streptomyces griseoflavus]KOG77249.1 2,4-diaminobutyric acid acetyltransferase [Kitasatospora aureofaciens]MYT48425.1 diaminobutyrate acetyltransferase [Streptomyces sp. SID5471]KEF05693.1 2,4-diaminobutyric acid acetyltransferase [Streptomyces rimosus]KEF17907.1 2,4-diaminobutyric acid acetyltransferase [Streptomyces rimosus]